MFDIGNPADPRQSILERYERGEITREQADAEACRCDFASMETRPDPSKFDPLAEPNWTIPMALAWIIHGDVAPVRELMENYRLGCKLWRHIDKYSINNGVREPHFELRTPEPLNIFDVISCAYLKPGLASLMMAGHDAREAFWRAMKLRVLIAEGIAIGRTSHNPIRDAEWETLSWEPEPSIPEDALAGRSETKPRYRRVFVRSADVIKLRQALVEAPNDAASTIDASYEESQDGALIPANSKAIREAIMAVYACALEQAAAIPNNREMCRFVNIILARKRGRANVTLIETLAGEVRAKERGGRYERLFCGSGETAARKNLQRSNKLNV
jgi:hypothetical protein